jgi:hypothetical protein
MLNLVYHETQDEIIYSVLSERMKDTFDIFDCLPDTIEDDWIDDEEILKERMELYINERDNAQNAFLVKYRTSIDAEAN